MPPSHPGEILLEELMAPLGVSQSRLARDLGVAERSSGPAVRAKVKPLKAA